MLPAGSLSMAWSRSETLAGPTTFTLSAASKAPFISASLPAAWAGAAISAHAQAAASARRIVLVMVLSSEDHFQGITLRPASAKRTSGIIRAMSGNTFGTLFAVTNFGESHGPAIGCVIDGCPPGMPLSEADIQPDLDRRRPGTSRHVTQRQEEDKVEIVSGVYEGRTTGTPICLFIRNTDQRSKDYSEIAQKFRPGHADYTYFEKYGFRDPRGGGRSSARLTAPMVAAGAVAKKWLKEKHGTAFRGCMQQIGEITIPFESWEHVPENPFFAPVADVSALEAYMDRLRKAGDSCGAPIRVRATGIPVGLGRPLFGTREAEIAGALTGAHGAKGRGLHPG